jgi:hypothetical protein
MMSPRGDNEPDRPRVLARTTGKRSERIPTIPITRSAGQAKRVVMSLGPSGRSLSRLADLAPGDRLHVMAELEVTTDHFDQRHAVGKAYGWAPYVQAHLLLAADADTVDPGQKRFAICRSRSEQLTHRQHHRVIVFDESIELPDDDVPWHVNLVLQANHRRAVKGHQLLVGENEPDRTVGQDKGRLNVVRVRPGSHASPKPARTEARKARTIPVIPSTKRVVYSKRLAGLRADEQLEVRATMPTSTAHLSYPARVSTRVLLTDSPSATDTGGHAAQVAAFGGEVCEHNGFNCEGETCVTKRVGVLHIERPATAPLYMNLVADSGDPLKEGKAKTSDRLRVLDGGGLEIVRYSAELKG